MPGFDPISAAEVLVDEVEDDRELNSPKMLPTTPTKGSSDMLDKLNQKLEMVAEHPEENEPEVLKHGREIENSMDRDAKEMSEGDGESSGSGDVEAALDKGIRLKTRRSMNFGAQLGMLR